MKYRACYKPHNGELEDLGLFDTRKKAIDVLVDYKFGCFSADKKCERRKGLETRGWAIIGYGGNELSVVEVEG